MKQLIKKFSIWILMVMLSISMITCGSSTGNKESSTENGTTDGQVSKKLQELRDKGTMIVGASGDAPFSYIDKETEEFKGVDAEIIKEVAKRLGIKEVKMQLIPYSELILNLNSNNIDIIADCMYITAERAKQIYYGDVWYTQGGSLVVAEGSNIKGQSDFDPSSTTVGYTAGTIWQSVIEGWENDGLIKKAVPTGDQSESLVALQYGKVDAFLTDSTVLEDLFNNSPDTVKGLKLCENYTDTSKTIGHIAPSVTKANKDFMKEVNEVVMQLRDEGFIEKVFKDYGLDPELHMISNDESERVYKPEEN